MPHRAHRAHRAHRHRHHRRHRHHHHHHHHNHDQPTQWHTPTTDMLIDERERRNAEYHTRYGRSRQDFWESVARRYILFICSLKKNLNSTIHLCKFRINRHFHTNFMGQQCSQKWRNLVRDYNVSKKHNFIL